MGEVYRALDTRLEREVALKLVSASYLSSDAGSGSPSPPATPHSSHSSHERFLREARSAATLNHPNVLLHPRHRGTGWAALPGDGVAPRRHFEEVPRRRWGHSLPVDEVISFSQQAAAALAAAHAKGIIHRDIKPANLFVIDVLRGKRQIKILDFGLAKKQEGVSAAHSRTYDLAPNGAGDETAVGSGTATMGLTSPGSAVGTVAYMSPEQARGTTLDARTDLFSLGSVIYEMATGKPPFGGSSTADVFAALLREDPPPVSKVNPAMPKRLDPVVAKLLAKDPFQRYASAEQLQEDLDALAVHTGQAVGPARSKGTYWLWPSLAALLLLIVGGLAWWRSKPGASPPTPTGTEQSAAVTPKGTKDSLILADFVNRTGDPVFDTTLNQALQIDLEQSPVINIVSQQHLMQSVKYLGKPADTPLTPAIAREIGEREGMKAILTGTIANLGKEYVITLTAQNTATGDEIVSEQAQAPDKEHVLDALGKAAAAMRARLGEDLASIKMLDTPFGQATTGSLEAFRAYALG